MSDLIRRRRAVTTRQSSEPPAQSTSAATEPALMDHLAVGPVRSQAPASSASSVAQPISTRRRHWPASTTDTTSTDVSGSQLVDLSDNSILSRNTCGHELRDEELLVPQMSTRSIARRILFAVHCCGDEPTFVVHKFVRRTVSSSLNLLCNEG
ncbi:hypothetical protein L3X38_036117 [Prunus dulcis]|uniref:Uncharacterized protein n=1 Tax=Prunus dulcis TaxID=3755 RepID=A0AAD4V0M3_PRUDU|nr:hypothetical protein L3X38_036117 [Prunus dulcis]